MHTQCLFLSNTDSIKNNPLNTASEFICELPYALELPSNYACGLMEIKYNNSSSEELLVETDIIEYSYVFGYISPVLRVVSDSGIFATPYFFKLKQQRINRIKISIKKINGETATLTGITKCVLGFLKIRSI